MKLNKLDLTQPRSGIAYSLEQPGSLPKVWASHWSSPSNVLGGRAAIICHPPRSSSATSVDPTELVPPTSGTNINDKTGQINSVLAANPLRFYLEGATEIDVDCLSDVETVFVAGIMEHIEEAGIHSGDSACSLRPVPSHPKSSTVEAPGHRTGKGPRCGRTMNVQFMKDGTLYILEVNPAPRAPCRSLPRSSACRWPRSHRASWQAKPCQLQPR